MKIGVSFRLFIFAALPVFNKKSLSNHRTAPRQPLHRRVFFNPNRFKKHPPLKAKKSYGQHFLTNEHIAERIADSLRPEGRYRHLVEVGPGTGMLTKYLLEKELDLKVVEADRDMVIYLDKHFPALRGRIIGGSFLKTPLDDLFGGEPLAVIGNFPYNISSQILFHTLKYRDHIPEVVGMFQREMAERVIAGPGSKTYGVISVLVQAHYAGEMLFTVSKGNFNPPPKVQSAVIRLERRTAFELDCDERLFRRIVKQVFGQRRKMLRNTLKSIVPDHPMLAEKFFQQRPERLSVSDFEELTQRVQAILSEDG